MKRRAQSHWTLRRWKAEELPTEPHDPFPGCFCPCHRRPTPPRTLGRTYDS